MRASRETATTTSSKTSNKSPSSSSPTWITCSSSRTSRTTTTTSSSARSSKTSRSSSRSTLGKSRNFLRNSALLLQRAHRPSCGEPCGERGEAKALSCSQIPSSSLSLFHCATNDPIATGTQNNAYVICRSHKNHNCGEIRAANSTTFCSGSIS